GDLRAALREDLIHEAFDVARSLLPAIDVTKLGSRSMSASFEAAKCFGEIVRGIGAMEAARPRELPGEDRPQEIRIFTGMMPPPETIAAHDRGDHDPPDPSCTICSSELRSDRTGLAEPGHAGSKDRGSA